MANKVEIKTMEELEKMHTGTLMKRRAALLNCEETFQASDQSGSQAKPSPSKAGIIEYKDSLEWQLAYKDLKAVLATREHMPNKLERKKIRQLKAKKSK